MPVDQPFSIYREQLTSKYHGLALWNPKPVKGLYDHCGHVSIGDVGYLCDGDFIRMFNVTLPWDDSSNEKFGKPEKYEVLGKGRIRENEFFPADYYSPHVSKEENASNAQADILDEAKGQTYKCRARNRGALLSLPHGGHREDIIGTKSFENYIRDNVVSWFTWAQNNKELGIERMEDLILVTGCTLVTSWAAAAFDDYTTSVDATSISLDTQKFDRGGALFFWRNIRGNVEYHNSHFDPNDEQPLPQNQCVFIRGFRAKRVFFRTIPIRAAAEPLPDDPDNRGEDEIQVTQIPNVSNYRDPIVGILDYMVEKCVEDVTADDIIVIAHDDDLHLIKDTETLTADIVENFLRDKQMPLFVENGAASLRDLRENESSVSDEKKAAFYTEAELTRNHKGESPHSSSVSSRLGRFAASMGTRPNAVLPRRMLSTPAYLRGSQKGSIRLPKDDDNIHLPKEDGNMRLPDNVDSPGPGPRRRALLVGISYEGSIDPVLGMSSTGQGNVNGRGDRATVHHWAGVGASAAAKNSTQPDAHGIGSSNDGDSPEAIIPSSFENEIMSGFIPRGPGSGPARRVPANLRPPSSQRVIPANPPLPSSQQVVPVNPPPSSSQRGPSLNVPRSNARPAGTTSNPRTTAGYRRP